MSAKKNSPYFLTSKAAKARATKIAKARAMNAKNGGLTERARRLFVKMNREFAGV